MLTATCLLGDSTLAVLVEVFFENNLIQPVYLRDNRWNAAAAWAIHVCVNFAPMTKGLLLPAEP